MTEGTSISTANRRLGPHPCVNHSTAFPAEIDDLDTDLPDTLPPANSPSTTDPLKQLRDLNTDTLTIDDTNISQITDVLDK